MMVNNELPGRDLEELVVPIPPDDVIHIAAIERRRVVTRAQAMRAAVSQGSAIADFAAMPADHFAHVEKEWPTFAPSQGSGGT